MCFQINIENRKVLNMTRKSYQKAKFTKGFKHSWSNIYDFFENVTRGNRYKLEMIHKPVCSKGNGAWGHFGE